MGESSIYAVVEAGGKQYRVTPGQVLDVDRMDVAPGEKIELGRVLVLGRGDDVTIGTPVVEGAKVMATARDNGRARKVLVFKYKPKVRYRRKIGHRQPFTRLVIDEIVGPDAAAPVAVRKRPATRRRKQVTADGS